MADFLPGRGCAQANFSQFLRRENAQMAAFLRRCLEVGDRGRTIEQIRDGKAKPSQQLADEQKWWTRRPWPWRATYGRDAIACCWCRAGM